jgi:hypothetical protein
MGEKRKRKLADRYREDGQYSLFKQPTKKETRSEVKTDKLEARANLARAKAEKRRWLVYLIGISLLGYMLISTGSASKGLEFVKGFFQ